MEKLNYETIQKHQSFNTIDEMDQAVRGFLYKHKGELSEGTLSVLHVIWKHSVKVIGVSYAKYEYIAEQIKMSRRTVIRAVNVLEEKGFIKKIPTARMNGKQGVNLLVIQPFASVEALKHNKSPQDVTLPDTPNKTENKQSSLCEKKKEPNDVSKPSEPSLHQLDASYLPDSVHQEFIEAAKPFFNAIEIYGLWKRVLIAYNKLDLERNIYEVMYCIVDSFKQTVFAKKLGKIHSTFEGYFYRIVYANLLVEKRRENRHKLYDFIGD
ncbi:helix-turn-helix domain-containing protein [uncultured Metabacillus sp.]|uniref:helix-turn-helix domain-containing protein n=1 Tax=uncultured Metabacillus sp. TaxID=2860135 RepID=UPI00260FB18A|nr:helix-turn-helix domain-containing protein [uncultured Metabacillus sp.]